MDSQRTEKSKWKGKDPIFKVVMAQCKTKINSVLCPHFPHVEIKQLSSFLNGRNEKNATG